MSRILTVGVLGLMAILLLGSDASACFRRRSSCAVATNDCCTTSYAGSVPVSGSGYSTGQPGYDYVQPGYDYGYGRPGYNPGGIGGPASGLGVRPGLGFGGLGGRR